MCESRTIRFYNADDWVWVFADDRCVFSGHSVTGPMLLEVLKYESFENHYENPNNSEEALWGVDQEPPLYKFPTELFD